MNALASITIHIQADATVKGDWAKAIPTSQTTWLYLGDPGIAPVLSFPSLEAMTLFGLAVVEEAQRIKNERAALAPTLDEYLAQEAAENVKAMAKGEKVVGS